MGPVNSELISHLQTAITGWTAEVGAAQAALSKQIDGANGQLQRLLEALRQRNEHVVALSNANDEIARLKQSLQQSGLPAGAVTQYSTQAASADTAATRELTGTFDRLQAAVQSWTAQVTRSQGGLVEQFSTANGQLTRLLDLLASSNGSAMAVSGAAPELEGELEQLRHENSVLSSEVYALNIELESLRREQEAFASANLAAETERMLKQRREMERLETTLQDRESELAQARRAETELARETEDLRKDLARQALSEERLQQTLELQRHEIEQHFTALSALTREMEALRRAFLGEDVQTEERVDAGYTTPAVAAHLDEEASETIAALEARIAQLELESAETQVLKERLSDAQAQAAALEAAADARAVEMAALNDELSEVRAHIATREAPADEGGGEAGAFADQLASALSQVADLEAELAARNNEIAALSDQLAVQTDRVQDLQSRPSPAELESARTQIDALELAVVQLQADIAAATSATVEVHDLDEEVARLQARIDDLESRPEPEELAALESALDEREREREREALAAEGLRETVAALEERAAALESSLNEREREREAEALAAEGLREMVAALEQRAAALESLLGERDAEREADARTMAQLSDALAALEARPAASVEPAPAPELTAERDGLRLALANMETELAALRRREEEMVVQARALLDELETHRNYEAAQDQALSQARNDLARVQEALGAANLQIEALRETLAAAEAAAGDAPAAAETIARLEYERGMLQQQYDARLEEARVLAAERDQALAEASARARELEEAVAAALASSMAADSRNTVPAEALAHQEALLERQAAELQEYRDTQRTAEKWIADLEQQLASALAEQDALRYAHVELESKYSAFAGELDAVRSRESARGDAVVEARAEAAMLAGQIAENEVEIERLRGEVAEKTRAYDAAVEAQISLEAVYAAEREETSGALRSIEDALAAARAELEITRARVAELEAESVELARGAEASREAEAAARTRVAEQQEALQAQEAQANDLEARVARLAAEREQIALESEERQQEIRLAVAQANQAVNERDEVLEALEAERARKGRAFAGVAGEATGAADSLDARQERARQQDIVVSELAHPDPNRSLGDILVDAGLLTPEQLNSALEAQSTDPSQLLGTILIEREYSTDDAIAQAVACQLKKPVVNPMEVHVQKNAIAVLNRDLCTWHVCIPLRMTEDRMVVAMANPLDESAILKLRDVSQREITPVVGTATHIMGAIENYYGAF